MKGAVLYGPRDVRFEEREVPKLEKPTDAIIRIWATCVCGGDGRNQTEAMDRKSVQA